MGIEVLSLSFNWGIGVCIFAIFPLEVLSARGRGEERPRWSNELERGLKLFDIYNKRLNALCIFTNAGELVTIISNDVPWQTFRRNNERGIFPHSHPRLSINAK